MKQLFTHKLLAVKILVAVVFCLSMRVEAQSFSIKENSLMLTPYSISSQQTLVFAKGRLLVNAPETAQGRHVLSKVKTILFNNAPLVPTDITPIGQNQPVVTLFPNPVQTELTIRFSEIPADKTRLSIFSIDGKLVYADAAPVIHSLDYQLWVSFLAPGMYMLRIANGQEIHNLRFIKK